MRTICILVALFMTSILPSDSRLLQNGFYRLHTGSDDVSHLTLHPTTLLGRDYEQPGRSSLEDWQRVACAGDGNCAIYSLLNGAIDQQQVSA